MKKPRIRLLISWLVLLVAGLLAAGNAFGRDEPPQNLNPAERLQWFESQCTRLTAEVDDIEFRRLDYEEINAAGTRLMNRIKLPTGERMYDRIQALDRERNQYPNDRNRAQAYNNLHDQYTGRMTELIPEERDLTWRGIRNFAELDARYKEAKRQWAAVETRYPLAKSERDRVCEERDVLKRELQHTPAPQGFRDGDIIGRIVGFSGVVAPTGRPDST